MANSRFQLEHRSGKGAESGVSLIDVALVLCIVGLLVQAILFGESLIHAARVRSLITQQQAAESALLAFQDRYRQPPGDYDAASANISCQAAPCLNGNGNGLVESGSAAGVREDVLVWTHMGGAGFLANSFSMSSPMASPARENTPSNVFGGYMHVASDARWGYSDNSSIRLNIKAGNLIPVDVLAEVDRKIDDGLPAAGRFQFSAYAAVGTAPTAGSPTGCTDADSTKANWNLAAAQADCGGATLVH